MGDLTTETFENITKILDIPKLDKLSDISFFADFCKGFSADNFSLEIFFWFCLIKKLSMCEAYILILHKSFKPRNDFSLCSDIWELQVEELSILFCIKIEK